jgi:hypothetical protein
MSFDSSHTKVTLRIELIIAGEPPTWRIAQLLGPNIPKGCEAHDNKYVISRHSQNEELTLSVIERCVLERHFPNLARRIESQTAEVIGAETFDDGDDDIPY